MSGTTPRRRSFAKLRAMAAPSGRDSIPVAAIEARLSAAAKLELSRALHHLQRAKAKTKGTKVGHMSNQRISGDVPSEMSELSDGVNDDGAMGASIIGSCSCDGVSGGLSDIAIGGLPSYLFSRANLANPVIRRRLSANIKAMTPKLRRRVLSRLKLAVRQADRVSGEVRSAYPSVSGYSGGYPSVGWTGVSVGRCPVSSVAGPLTP